LWAATEWRRGTRRRSWTVPAVVTWAGIRGVVPLAAALSIPLSTANGIPLPYRDLVLVLAAVTIALSVVVQGFTLEPLARFAGMAQQSGGSPGGEEPMARLRLAEAGLARLEELAGSGAAPVPVADRLRVGLQARIGASQAAVSGEPDGHPDASMTEQQLRGDLIEAQADELSRLYADGTISMDTRRRLQQGLDLEAARLSGGHR
jgi:monovalent cation/hydrogen antiporter